MFYLLHPSLSFYYNYYYAFANKGENIVGKSSEIDLLLIVQQSPAIIVVNLLYSNYTYFFTVNTADVVVTP